jgi:hypothetical protein
MSATRIRRLLLAPFAATVLASSANAALVISTAPTSNVTCSAGSCSATAHDAVLNVVDLKTLLHRGDVRVASGPADTIAADATLAWTQASRLTLVARTAITVSQPVVVEGAGAVALTTTDDRSAGAIAFNGRGRLDFWSVKDRLTINGNDYTLAGDVAALASAIAANPYGNFALARDYDASPDFHGMSPIPLLLGNLNGLGHAISHLRIMSAERCVGFIAFFGASAAPSISNLVLAQVDITTDGSSYGVGGLAGCSAGAIAHVRVSGRVDGGNGAAVGGIVGQQNGEPGATGPISDSSVQVAVSGGTGSALGGVAGWVFAGNIQRCAAAGRIEGSMAAMVGGVIGLLNGNAGESVTGNWSSAQVNGAVEGGGLVGEVDGWSVLTDNYATGSVSGAAAGGLVGKMAYGASAMRSYARGVVRSGGGITGTDDGTGIYGSAYWDMDTTHVRNPAQGVYNILNVPGVTGFSDAQLRAGLPAGFDPAMWAQNASVNNGYPYLIANPPQ